MNDYKILPNNIDAEKAVLGCMILEKEAIAKALNILQSDDFYHILNSFIFEEIKNAFLESSNIDEVIISEKLRNNEKAEKVLEANGGATYLTNLYDFYSNASTIEEYAYIVKEKSDLRKIIAASNKAIRAAFKETDKAIDVVNECQSELFNIAMSRNSKKLICGDSIFRSIYRDIDKRMNGEIKPDGIPTGFTRLDQATGGLQRGDLIVLAARTSMGKTTFAINIADNIARQQQKAVAFFSLETTSSLIGYKFLSSATRIDGRVLQRGTINESHKQRLIDCKRAVITMPLYIDDSSYLNIANIQIRAKGLAAELQKSKTPLELIIIDYMQLVKNASLKQQNREREIAEVSQGLKQLSKDLNVSVVALSQLSRQYSKRDNKKPVLSDLRDSGSIEQDADIVLFIHRDWYDSHNDMSKNQATLILAKNRNGGTGEFEINYNFDVAKYENLNGGNEYEY
ncbi:MAG: replicative DNA helicase [Elusimicrobiota bacterium]|jgi:replicative DNA helicase|nr:replicative DNA helicase [Elusimicrobiota bacterium]